MGGYDLPVPRPLGAWAERAACKGMDQSIFFPGSGSNAAEAKAVCASCFVRPECLHHAITSPEKYGIWGGVSEKHRRGDPTRLCRRCGADYVRPGSTSYCAPCAPLAIQENKERAYQKRKLA
jgi:hypothetical protein